MSNTSSTPPGLRDTSNLSFNIYDSDSSVELSSPIQNRAVTRSESIGRGRPTKRGQPTRRDRATRRRRVRRRSSPTPARRSLSDNPKDQSTDTLNPTINTDASIRGGIVTDSGTLREATPPNEILTVGDQGDSMAFAQVSSTFIHTSQEASDYERSDTLEASLGNTYNFFQSNIPIGNYDHSKHAISPHGDTLADVDMNGLNRQNNQPAASRPSTPIYNPFGPLFGFEKGVMYNELHFSDSQNTSIQGETKATVDRGETFNHLEILSPAIRQVLDQIYPPRDDFHRTNDFHVWFFSHARCHDPLAPYCSADKFDDFMKAYNNWVWDNFTLLERF
ncbi:hypothetical protein GLAREA_07992 [Glarea lozoyensis ATCC 20868]|uniref:Uncharacterized protein n=1 Tax=Glarea lozoyensis (strain ATCC 20868 / MF5171) TaxID=1116229 RepID=S3CC32_GLAL2|nr:uncharacterized protein GLAREA_07992 [Glarea lozoyensis ATCC 20868]EPE24142.1 hypothetical protein GLAREA_07992 [Glarea lozoyensis ATCC 20868]